MKKLPIGIQTFSKIREDNYCYVDKTPLIESLLHSGSYFFLSRPRRFGKSLFLDTLKEAFSGNQELFKGLYLKDHWDWNVVYPVIKFDFGSGITKTSSELDEVIHDKLNRIIRTENLEINSINLSEKFKDVILSLEKKYSNRVVILIDEYDKPILDNITDSIIAKQMRDGLRDLYSVIKTSDAHIKFVFITGVSKFSKINLFSGLNNIEDITLNKKYATICGYTESELSVFQDYLVDVNRDELKLWYNGYNFLGDKVYNPFDILLYLRNKEFSNYWFETGNPTFLIDLIYKNKYNLIDIEFVQVTEEEMGSFDVDNIRLEVLLFQTGYLTILEKTKVAAKNIYTLTYPNREVKSSLNSVVLTSLSDHLNSSKIVTKLYKILLSSSLDELKPLFQSFFASIPHDWYRKNQLAGYEAYYASIFYTYFASLGLDVRPEEVTNHGQVDMVVFLENKVFVFEFKVVELTEKGSALQQIKEKKYYEKYLDPSVDDRHSYHQQMGDPQQMGGREIYLIGVEFSKEERNITNFEWDSLIDLQKKADD